MKRFNSIAKYFLAASLAVAIVACEDESKSPSVVKGSEFTAAEPDGLVTLGFQLNEPTSKEVKVTIAVTGGTADEGTDFELVESSRTIAAGESNGSFSVNLFNELIDEDDETVEFTITAEGISTTGKYTLTITDDDCPFDFVGDLVGTDANVDKQGFLGEGAVTITQDGDSYTIEGLNVDFVTNFWGEEVIDQVPVTFTVDEEGKITIEDQYIFTTLYDGDEYPYHIYGTGVVNTCEGTITLDYEMDQEGFKVGAYIHAAPRAWMTDPIFKAVLHLPE